MMQYIHCFKSYYMNYYIFQTVQQNTVKNNKVSIVLNLAKK